MGSLSAGHKAKEIGLKTLQHWCTTFKMNKAHQGTRIILNQTHDEELWCHQVSRRCKGCHGNSKEMHKENRQGNGKGFKQHAIKHQGVSQVSHQGCHDQYGQCGYGPA